MAVLGTWLQVIGSSATDTIITVTVPVMILLGLLEWLETSGRFNPTQVLGRAGPLQPVYAAAIAAIPGCAGGIAVSRLYLEGTIAAAALWAGHLATAGDASFVLLVGKPLDAIGIFVFLFVLGSLIGVIAARMRGKPAATALAERTLEAAAAEQEEVRLPSLARTWLVLLGATAVLALVGDVVSVPAVRVATMLFAAASIVVAIMVYRSDECGCEVSGALPDRAQALAAAASQAAKDAAEITLWVAAADLAFYAVQHVWGPQVSVWLHGQVLVVTILAAVVGMIPGCGPQIFLARLYTAGSLPFVAILANSVSQHGDAIFPLFGKGGDGRRALQVTLASVVVGVVLGVAAFGLHLGGA